MLADLEIKEKVEKAFPPYRCVAEVWDYSTKLRFRIFDADDRVLKSVEKVTLTSVRNERDLNALCQMVRNLLPMPDISV